MSEPEMIFVFFYLSYTQKHWSKDSRSNGNEIQVHQTILQLRSEYFWQMLQDHWFEGQQR